MKTRIQTIKKAIITLITILCITLSTYSQETLGSIIVGEDDFDESGYSVSMPDANTVAIGAIYNNDNGTFAGHVRVFWWSLIDWQQKGQDIRGEAPFDQSGYSVCMPDANTVAIGSPYSNEDAGQVRIFSWGPGWTQKGLSIIGESEGDISGKSVSMPDANTVAIGAYGSYNYAGQVRVFSWNGNTWIQKGQNIKGEAFGDHSGSSVSMPDANTVAIGAHFNVGKYNDLESPGHVRVYTWNGNFWIQKGIDIDGKGPWDQSGISVSMPDANTVAIGAFRNNGIDSEVGYVSVYNWNGSVWTQKGMNIEGEESKDWSGWSVSMPDANTVAIGAPRNSEKGKNAGHVRVYTWSGNEWTQLGVDIDGYGSGAMKGYSVSMPDANTVAIGAPSYSGYVRIFSFSTVGIIENTFTDQFTINPNPTAGNLNINFDAIQEELNVSLFTIDGKLLENRTEMYTSNLSLEITSPPGIYLIKISNNKQEATVRVVKE